MKQDPLFYEDFRGAVKHLIEALGGPKNVGPILRPTKTLKQQRDWINDCLHPDRDTKFDLEDISTLLAEGRKRGIHCAINQLCDEAEYRHPDIAPKKSPDQVLAEEMEHHLREFKRLADERAASQAEVRAVK